MPPSSCVGLNVLLGSGGRWPALMQGACVVLCRPMWALSPSALRPLPHRPPCPARIAFRLPVALTATLPIHSILFPFRESSGMPWRGTDRLGRWGRCASKDPPGVVYSPRTPPWGSNFSYVQCTPRGRCGHVITVVGYFDNVIVEGKGVWNEPWVPFRVSALLSAW